jgi:hypothetical protein
MGVIVPHTHISSQTLKEIVMSTSIPGVGGHFGILPTAISDPDPFPLLLIIVFTFYMLHNILFLTFIIFSCLPAME